MVGEGGGRDHLPQDGRDRVEEARQRLLVEHVRPGGLGRIGHLVDHHAQPRLQRPVLAEELVAVGLHVELAHVDALEGEAGQVEEELDDVGALQLDAALHRHEGRREEMWEEM